MKQTITALICVAEITFYEDDGRVKTRPKPIQFEAFEADIPQEVLDWVRGKLPQGVMDGR